MPSNFDIFVLNFEIMEYVFHQKLSDTMNAHDTYQFTVLDKSHNNAKHKTQ